MPATTKRYTIADVRFANEAAGYYFWKRTTMRFHKDRVADWGVWHRAGRVFIHRKTDGQVREFFPDTGNIGLPMKSDDIPTK